jgi:alanine racemase
VTTSGSLPRAVISRSALRESARAAVHAGGTVADLRADAFGHGVHEAARIIQSAGVSRVVVDEVSLASLRGDGIDAVTDEAPDIDSTLLYGLPGSGQVPAMVLTGRMLSRKLLRAGEAVSYGYTHRAERDTTIALVTGGYAQGIVRALGNNATVGIGAGLRPIIGRVAMDVCVIDLQTDEAPERTDVVYFGAGPAVDGLSAWARVTGLRMTELIAVAGAKAVREWTH